MKRRLTVFSTHTESTEFRLYHDDLRKFLGLPVKKGKFSVVVANENAVHITFECQRNKCVSKTVS